MNTGVWILFVIIGVMIGLVGGFFGARYYMIKYFEENPPIDETMLRTMMIQMGQKPSETKIRQLANSIKMQAKRDAKNKKKKK
ncbi:YneF family protein [Atopobacter phocae]|uniref:YneF family protein n=1 Tax=Atopobacter phocae TaxID=136492 RepID=UPI000471A7BA|nr:YneF family protein [Atopobacter phocae]